MTEGPSAPPRPRETPWPMIAGVVVLTVLALILLVLLLTRDSDGDTASGSPTPTAAGSASASASGSVPASAGETAAATPAPGTAAPDLATDSVVATMVEGLTVRAGPSLEGDRLGTLEDGALSFVASGPTDAEGFRWYLVSGLGLPPNSGCAGPPETDPFNCPIWFGWVAAASESGEPWLVEHEIACPQAPYTAETLALGRTALERLACLGSEPFTFRGYWPEIPEDAGLGGACAAQDAPSGWLLCQNINFKGIVIDETEDMFGVGIRVSIDPATDVTMPERGTWVEVRVHLDDPAAQSCDEDASTPDVPPEQTVLTCRAEAVLEAAQAVDGP